MSAGPFRWIWALRVPGARFEYPPYFSWELGLLWVVVVFGFISAVAAFAPAAAQPPGPKVGAYTREPFDSTFSGIR